MVSDEGVIAIAHNCPQLHTLVFLDAVNSAQVIYTSISDRSLIAVAKNCPHIQSLCVPDIDISDEGRSTVGSYFIVRK